MNENDATSRIRSDITAEVTKHTEIISNLSIIVHYYTLLLLWSLGQMTNVQSNLSKTIQNYYSQDSNYLSVLVIVNN